MQELPIFDYSSMVATLDVRRTQHGLGWTQLANTLWNLELDAEGSRPSWPTW